MANADFGAILILQFSLYAKMYGTSDSVQSNFRNTFNKKKLVSQKAAHEH